MWCAFGKVQRWCSVVPNGIGPHNGLVEPPGRMREKASAARPTTSASDHRCTRENIKSDRRRCPPGESLLNSQGDKLSRYRSRYRVRMTKTRILKSRMTRKCHVRFGSGGEGNGPLVAHSLGAAAPGLKLQLHHTPTCLIKPRWGPKRSSPQNRLAVAFRIPSVALSCRPIQCRSRAWHFRTTTGRPGLCV